MRFTLVLRELEKIERPVDVDVMGGDRRELGARRQQRRQVDEHRERDRGRHERG